MLAFLTVMRWVIQGLDLLVAGVLGYIVIGGSREIVREYRRIKRERLM